MAHKHISSHDHFFRAAMAEPKVVNDFFQAHLPTKIQEIISWNSIQLKKESYVDDQLKLQITDMLYAANFDNKPGYIYLLVEHQSTADKLMPFRLLKYMLAIQENHLKQNKEKKLALIYPLIFYTGARSTNHVTDIFELFGEQQELAKEIFLKPYHLIDLTKLTDEDLKQYLWSGVMAKSMKHIYDTDIVPCLKNMLNELQTIEKQDGMSYIYTILSYLVNTGDTENESEFIETIKLGFSEQTGDNVMTIAQRFREEGLTEGRMEGIIEGQTRGKVETLRSIVKNLMGRNADINEIIAITGLSLHEINELKKTDTDF